MRLTAGGTPAAVKCRAINLSSELKTSLYNVHSKFHERRSAGSKVEVAHTQFYNIIRIFFFLMERTAVLLKLSSLDPEKQRRACQLDLGM
jgi:hypothetical protein